MTPRKLQRVAVACLLLSVLAVATFIVGFGTCLESRCAGWHQAVNTVAFFAAPTFLALTLVALTAARIGRSR